MPLKLLRRGEIFYVRGTVNKVAVYETTGTSDRNRAEAYRARRENEIWDRSVFGERAVVTFAEAALSYLDVRQPGARERRHIDHLLDHFCPTWRLPNPDAGTFTIIGDIDQSAVDKASLALTCKGSKPATRQRNVVTPLTSILNHAARRGWCTRPAFERPKQPKGKTRWLTPAEAQALILNSAEHLRPLLIFLLGTGARLSEALYLDWADVDLAQAKAVFRETKNEKERPARLPSAAVAALASLDHREGPVFLRPKTFHKPATEPYADRGKVGGGQIKTGFKAACRRAGLGHWEEKVFVPNVTPHDLRHTWASWFYAISKDPMLLKVEGGWSTLALVERYAHLMPSGLVAEIRTVWGDSHPTLGDLPTRAPSVQSSRDTA